MKKIILITLFFAACSSPQPDVAIDNTNENFLIINKDELSFDEKIKLQEEIIHRQEIELEKQQRELDELKRQNIYNKAVKEYKDKHEIR